MLHSSNFSNEFRQLAKRAVLGSIGPHFASHGCNRTAPQGLHPKVVADRLGHASTRMTLNVYSQVMPALESDAAAKMDFALREAFGQQSGQQNKRRALASGENDAANAYGVKLFRGGRNRARTCDPLLVREVLYQLSYSPLDLAKPRHIGSCGLRLRPPTSPE
jgi:hypothetical protein